MNRNCGQEQIVAPDLPGLAARLCDRYRDIIDAPQRMQETLLRPLPVTLWTNTLRLRRAELMALLHEDGLRASPVGWNAGGLKLPADARPGRHWGFLAGLFRIQEEVSMLPVQLLDPQPGERILDLCAAPGNKTAQIALAMQNTGTVVANDAKRGRIAAIRQTVKRLGLINCTVTVRDGQGIDRRAGTFDRVLVDAPCTCEGTFRKVRVPRIVDADTRNRAVRLQTNLLRRAIRLTRTGGRIVYSTCTFAPEENEGVVDAMLREQGRRLRLLPARVPGFDAAPGVTMWMGRSYDPRVRDCLRVWPHREDTGGFFVAVLEKVGGEVVERVPAFSASEESRNWLTPFIERLGMPDEVFRGVRLVRRGNQHIHAVPDDHVAPRAPAPELLGLPVVRRRSLPLKPTTASIVLWGHHASRNVVTLRADQAMAYLLRQACELEQSQLTACTGPGYAVVRLRNRVIGLGQLVYSPVGAGVKLLSLVPKTWVRDGVDAVYEAD